MKEFIEKLIGRLEESVSLPKNERMESRVGKKQTQGFVLGVRSSVEIVKKLAEEYSSKSRELENNGWIPCSERLPEESGYYMACIYNSEVDDFDFRKIWFAHVDDYDMEESEWRELYGFESVTAWKSLPEPLEAEE